MNPIRWWLTWGVHMYFWWTKGRPKPNPKPMTEPRDENGHLTRRKENGKWVQQ